MSEFVEVEGVRLRASIQGRGRPLLLLNGLGASFELLEPFRERLGGTETIALDMPGTGESDTTLFPRSVRGLAGLVRSALDALGYTRVDVLGVSWGGILAQEVVRRHGDRVRRLVLAATGPGWPSVPGRLSAIWALATPRRYTSPEYLERVAPMLYGGAARTDPALLREHARLRFIRPPSLRGYLWQLVAISGWSSLLWLRSISQPTLVLAGEDDPIASLINSRLMAWLLPNSRLHVVRDGGHLFLLTHAAEVAPVVESFLDE